MEHKATSSSKFITSSELHYSGGKHVKGGISVKACSDRWLTGTQWASVEKLPANKEESGEREAIFRRFTASAVPTSERIPALYSGARISERGLGFGKEEDEPEAHGLV
ncbi:hypothetical protein U1Q18_002288 [Sarracenia purpurea var. burkii]